MLSCTPGNGGFSALFLFRCEMTTEKNKKLRFSLQNWDLYVILKKFYTGKYVKTYKFCWILVISLTPFRLSLFCRNCILSEAGATDLQTCVCRLFTDHTPDSNWPWCQQWWPGDLLWISKILLRKLDELGWRLWTSSKSM